MGVPALDDAAHSRPSSGRRAPATCRSPAAAIAELDADGYYARIRTIASRSISSRAAEPWPWSPELFRVQREIVDPLLEEAVLDEPRRPQRARRGAPRRPKRHEAARAHRSVSDARAHAACVLGCFFLYPLGVAAYESFYAWDLLTPAALRRPRQLPRSLRGGELVRASAQRSRYSVVVVTARWRSVSRSRWRSTGRADLRVRARRDLQRLRRLVGRGRAALDVAARRRRGSALDLRLARAAGCPRATGSAIPSVALVTLAAVVSVWKITGYAMVIFLAGLQDIPPVAPRGRRARRRRRRRSAFAT